MRFIIQLFMILLLLLWLFSSSFTFLLLLFTGVAAGKAAAFTVIANFIIYLCISVNILTEIVLPYYYCEVMPYARCFYHHIFGNFYALYLGIFVY